MAEHTDEHVHDPVAPQADCPQAEGKQAHSEGLNTYRVRVTGRVQGVNFRQFTRQAAEALCICGWVRNEPDGSVVAVLQSPETRLLELLIAQLHEGPAGARVERVYVEQLAGEPLCDGFAVRR